jgi:hypothetical protein
MRAVSYIVESFCGYEAAKSAHTAGKALWLTTSPGLLEKLKAQGENVSSLEAGADQAVSDSLARAGYDFTLAYCDLLNEQCAWREYADIRLALAFGFNQCFFPSFYKARLLQNILDQRGPDDPVVCVGDSTEVHPSGFGLLYNRFDTLYAVLGRRTGDPALKILEHKVFQATLDDLVRYSKARRMGAYEKLLSVLNNTPGSFFAKAVSLLNRKHLFPFRHFGLFPWSKRYCYIHKGCELIDEVLPHLLLRGVRIGFLPSLPKATSDQIDIEDLPDRAQLEAQFSSMLRTAISSRGLEFPATFHAAESLLKRRFFTVLARLHAQLPILTKGFDGVAAHLKPRARILTNALTAPEERLFASYCASKAIEVTAFEHGLVYGLSKWSAYCARHAGMLAASSGIYHSVLSRDEIAPHAPEQRTVIGGLPEVIESIRMRPVQRSLGRRILRVGTNAHMVLFVANLDRNNYVYGPHMENDLQNHDRTRSVMDFLLKAFPSSTIVLKLYPTARYLDQWDWPEYVAMENVRVIRDIDFRFIRAAADAIFVGSAQSTLGWCLGTAAPVFFLEPATAPVTFAGCSFASPGISEVSSVRFVTMQHCLPDSSDRRAMYKELLQ